MLRDDEFLIYKGRLFHNKAPLYEKLRLYSDVDRDGNAKLLLLTCINNLYLLSYTQPFLDTDPRPPACHMIMPQQTFTSFISNVTRHPSWPRLISHISARLSSYATFVAKNQTQAHIMALL